MLFFVSKDEFTLINLMRNLNCRANGCKNKFEYYNI